MQHYVESSAHFGRRWSSNAQRQSCVGVAAVCLAALELGGCGDDVERSVRVSQTDQVYQKALVKDVTPVAGKVVRTDKITVEPARMQTEEPPPWAAAGGYREASSPAERSQMVAHLDKAKPGQVEYLEYDDAKLAEVAAVLASRGVADPVHPDEVPQGDAPLQEKGWSCTPVPFWGCLNGADNRVLLSGYSNWEYKTIGRLWANGGCTGTLFGRRLVFTAAHCIIDSNGNYIAGTFQAARNGTSLPYSSQSVVGAWWGGWYISKCTGGAPGYWSDCMPEDWALLVLDDYFPYGHPGWLGYGALTESDTQTMSRYLAGYPGCGGADSPAGCQDNKLYGQLGTCSLGQFMYPFADGFNSTYSHGCDTSPGMSGSAMYTTGFGSFHIFSDWSVYRCTTCTVAQEPDATIRRNPNLNKRIDGYIFNLMSNLRATYP